MRLVVVRGNIPSKELVVGIQASLPGLHKGSERANIDQRQK